MGVIYRYLSSGLDRSTSSPDVDASSSSGTERLKRQVYRLFPSSSTIQKTSKEKDLNKTCIKSHDILFNSILFAIHYESVWWLRLNVGNYRRNRALILPRVDADSLFNTMEWKLYWQRFKARVWPAIYEYHFTLSIMYFLQAVMGRLVSKETMLRIMQHPYHRAIAVSKSSKDRIEVGTESFITCLWSNAMFFSASYIFGQTMILYNYHRSLIRGTAQHEADRMLKVSSWRLITTMVRRYYSSALGSGIGSIIWPGAGTMIGMGIGDGIAELTPEPDMPHWDFSGFMRGLLKQVSILLGGKGGKDYYSGKDSDDVDYSAYGSKHLDDELTCPCCQIVTFSSNPRCLERAPVSSRECTHTICKQCVEKCHLALMERIHTYQEWITCPICKATNAFSSHNHLVNRSLCGAISLMERRQAQYDETIEQMERQRHSQNSQQTRRKSPPP
ncbi:hypothetical protein IV203_029085 [Nitzschia inconspicua]|uniref:RING-type domain-containing protein n=1 Tax=Nitzschia inconspicua TaxID=303405 RepID=A0A9K3Q0W4_9STRA|nr:hypothetical protein IV203_029085 [Nitzschia inconspicua]